MAKKSVLSFTKPFGELGISDALFMTEQSKTKLVFTDLESGNEVTLDGEGFKVKMGKVTAGVVEDMTITSSQGKELLEFSGLDIEAKPLPKEIPIAFISAVLEAGLSQSNIINGSKYADQLEGYAGRDIIKGNAGADSLAGMAGRDVLFGGAGSDFFRFSDGDGKDKIMDFDADPSGGSQDLIIANYESVISETTVNGNTVLDFDNGDVLTLIGVKAKDIDETDFVI